MDKLLLTIKESAQRLALSQSNVRILVKSGDIPSIRIGKLYRIPVESLDEWIRSKAVASCKP